MTSKNVKEAYVWIWLPDETEPVVAGRLEADNGNVLFNYGKSYRNAAETLRLALPKDYPGCVASLGLGPSQRSSMQYFAGLRTRIVTDGGTDCNALLSYGQTASSATALERQGWKEVWEYRRGGGRQFETFRLYRRR